MEVTPAPPVEIFVDTRGAKIMEDERSSPDQRDSRDIYLPNHIETVSHIAVDVGGSLAKVVYFTRSRSSSDAKKPEAEGKRSSAGSPGLPQLAAAHSRYRSHENGEPPSTPPLQSGESSYPMPSGTLTPTAILNSPLLSTSMSAIQSTFLKRRSLPSALPGGRLNFIKFETSDIESCVRFLKELIETSARTNGVTIEEMRRGVKLMATGGGAHLFYDLFEIELGVEVRREDEMGCLITGLNFITLIPDEVFWYSDELIAALHNPLPKAGQAADPQIASSSRPVQDQPLPRPSPNPPLYMPVFDKNPSPKLPCLLVNIGSGVSIIKVDDYGKFERVSGTSLGGGTLWGLLSLLTDAQSFDEMLELSEKGDNSSVDMLVGDVYGSVGYNALGLKSSTIASSFGKVFRKDRGSQPMGAAERKGKFKAEDICRSLLYAISNNIGQIAYMNAEKYDLDRIYFGGCFIRGHKATISTLSYAIRFWSKGAKRAFFLRHEGYLGAIGAWIKHVGSEPGSVPLSEAASVPPASRDETAARTPASAVSEQSQANVASPANGASVPSTREPALFNASQPPLPAALAEALGATVPAATNRSGVVDGVGEAAQVGERPDGEGAVDLSALMASLTPSDRSLLGPLLSNGYGSGDGGAGANGDLLPEGDEDLSIPELLRRMEAAEGAADGLEGRLDVLLSKLDGMLENAEAGAEAEGLAGLPPGLAEQLRRGAMDR